MDHEIRFFQESLALANTIGNGLDPFPLVVEFYPTNVCNLSCSYCYGAKRTTENNQSGLLSISEYEKIFLHLRCIGIKHLSFSGGGEPFAFKGFYQLLLLASNLGFRIRVVTNGTLIKPFELSILLQLSEIRFSIDAFNPSTYSKIKSTTPKNLKRALRNLKSLIDMKKKGSGGPQIGASLTIHESNIAEVIPFAKSMFDKGIDAVIIKKDVYFHGENVEELNNISEQIELFKSSISSCQNLDLRNEEIIDPRGLPCYIPYFKVAVNPSGKVFSCCLGAQPGNQSGYLLGDLRYDAFQDVWQTSRSIRRQLVDGAVKCQICNYTDNRINRTMSNGYLK